MRIIGVKSLTKREYESCDDKAQTFNLSIHKLNFK